MGKRNLRTPIVDPQCYISWFLTQGGLLLGILGAGVPGGSPSHA